MSVTAALNLMRPAPIIALDIETMNPPAEVADKIVAEGMLDWQPPGNVKKAETIEQYRETAALKLRDRLALDDRAPISVIAIAGPDYVLAFHQFANAKVEVDGVTVIAGDGEAEMLRLFSGILDQVTDDGTELVGHNCLGFDFPRLRLRMLANGVTPPRALKLGAPNDYTDTMKIWRHFSVSDKARSGFASLDQVARALEVPSPKGAGIDGARVPGMIEAGEYQDVVTYCAADVAVTREVHRRLSAWRSVA